MKDLDALLGLAGLGLVLFGLRGLLIALDDGVVARLRPWVERMAGDRRRAFASGVGVTLGLQASAVTVIAAMGFVQRGLLGFEQALLVMLGATLGTSLKAWLFALPFHWLGPSVVGVSSLLLVVTRRYAQRRFLEIAFALGALYLGWHMIVVGLGPLLQHEGLAGLILGLDASSTPGLLLGIAAGCLITAVVQSSSTVVFLVIGLGGAGALRADTGVAVILGANVGTTVTPLLAALEYRTDVRRLALAHVLVKVLGVLVAALFFRPFLAWLELLSRALGGQEGIQLAAAHTGFNLLNSLAWVPLAPLLARRLAPRAGAGDSRAAPLLAESVRRLLANLPEEALEQAERERVRSLREIKVLVDRLLAGLRAEDASALAGLVAPRELLARVLAGQELLAGLLVRHAWTAEIQALLHELNCLEEVVEESIGLLHRLEIESGRFRELRRRAAPAFEGLQALFDQAWTPILTGSPSAIEPDAFTSFEAEAHRLLRSGGPIAEQDAVQIGKQIAHLQRIWARLRELDRTREARALPAELPQPAPPRSAGAA